MDGTKFVRIEIDTDEDGKIDRWEYFGADQKVEKVGSSRLNDGKPDLWAYQAADGTVSRIELSSKRGDGRPDKWETYANGALTTVGFDTKHTGTPDRVIDYRKENPTQPK